MSDAPKQLVSRAVKASQGSQGRVEVARSMAISIRESREDHDAGLNYRRCNDAMV